MRGLRYELRAAFLKLLTYLHLDHQVQTKLLMRGEFVLPRYECTQSIPLFMADNKTPHTPASRNGGGGGGAGGKYSLWKAPLPGCTMLASNIKHNITSNFSKTASEFATVDFSIGELKELVFSSLEKLLHLDYYKMYLLPLPGDTRSPVFVPMIEALDHLLVMGALKEERDLQRLLHLLDPNQFCLLDSECEL